MFSHSTASRGRFWAQEPSEQNAWGGQNTEGGNWSARGVGGIARGRDARCKGDSPARATGYSPARATGGERGGIRPRGRQEDRGGRTEYGGRMANYRRIGTRLGQGRGDIRPRGRRGEGPRIETKQHKSFATRPQPSRPPGWPKYAFRRIHLGSKTAQDSSMTAPRCKKTQDGSRERAARDGCASARAH